MVVRLTVQVRCERDYDCPQLVPVATMVSLVGILKQLKVVLPHVSVNW
jgi:hypothetical protein